MESRAISSLDPLPDAATPPGRAIREEADRRLAHPTEAPAAPKAPKVVRVLVHGVDDALALPFRGLVWAYRKTFSSALAPACRFIPSCSEYAAEALREHGFVRGLALSAWRIGRCQPFGKGGWDPVPPSRRRLASSQKEHPECR